MDVIKGLKKIKNNWSFKRLAQELGLHEKTLKNCFLGIYKPSSLASERI
jgi:lambda repressor-like predicted transcriptional regulator